jgi:hypothetical protein
MILSDMLSKSTTKQTLESTRSLKHIWDIAYSVRVWIVNEAQKSVASTFDSREGTPKALDPSKLGSLDAESLSAALSGSPRAEKSERAEMSRSGSY